MTEYNPRNWFWVVGGDESRAWSSADGSYTQNYPQDRLTRIATATDLNDVLRPYGLALPSPTQNDYKDAIQAHLDATARGRSYADGVSFASYKDSTNPQWALEATTFIAWRDQVWASAYTTLASVLAGQQPQPTMSELIGSLPEIAW